MSADATRSLLIVEDDPEIGYLLSVILDDDDREVLSVETGAEAIELLDRRSVDLIVLDLILPDMDGRTLLTKIRAREATATCPVVVLSARSGPEIRQECYTLGADVYTEKPFDPDEVAGAVTARLARRSPAIEATNLDPRTGLLNRAGLIERFEEGGRGGALALVQLDEFHAVTERWGWDVGEELLREAAAALAGVTEDLVLGRLGGGEFVVFSSGGSPEPLSEVAERLLVELRNVPYTDPDGESFRLTASIGVVALSDTGSLDEGLAQARRRLFHARESGNLVVSDEAVGDGGSARVLVAEDDEISATILLHRLEREGLDVVRYNNGKSAYEGALTETPDLVILDVKMPGMDGFEVLERLRRTPAYQKIPVIMLTSMGSEADVVRGFQLGADDYVLKPFSPTELTARVWRLLRRGRSANAL